MMPAGMHRKEGPAGQRGSLFKGPDAAGRPDGFIPPGGGWRASRCSVTLVARSTCYASTRVPRLARPAPRARRRGVLLGALNFSSRPRGRWEGQPPEGPMFQPVVRPPMAGSVPDGTTKLTQDLAGLEQVINRSAAGAARTSVRVQTLVREIDRIFDSTRAIQETLEGLGGNISLAAAAAEEGAESTRLMADQTRQGRQESDQAVATVRQLQDQTRITSERLESLMGHILQVNEVS